MSASPSTCSEPIKLYCVGFFSVWVLGCSPSGFGCFLSTWLHQHSLNGTVRGLSEPYACGMHISQRTSKDSMTLTTTDTTPPPKEGEPHLPSAHAISDPGPQADSLRRGGLIQGAGCPHPPCQHILPTPKSPTGRKVNTQRLCSYTDTKTNVAMGTKVIGHPWCCSSFSPQIGPT